MFSRRPVRLLLAGALLGAALTTALFFILSRDRSEAASCPPIAENPEWSVARRWDEVLLDAIRRDLPAPTRHARNLYHVSAAMYDAWAERCGVVPWNTFSQKKPAKKT